MDFRTVQSIVYLMGNGITCINMNIYEEYLFEIYLWLDILSRDIYVDSEVSYILMVFHLIILLNLKKFDSFWDIIDKKLSKA